jgi:hypothetical protein
MMASAQPQHSTWNEVVKKDARNDETRTLHGDVTILRFKEDPRPYLRIEIGATDNIGHLKFHRFVLFFTWY